MTKGNLEGQRVEVAKAKGRPMLSWVGKRPLREVRAFPSQLVERVAPETPAGVVAEGIDWSDWPERFDRGGLLFHGDNKEVLAHLLATGFRGKVDLVYIDPPFDSGDDVISPSILERLAGQEGVLAPQIDDWRAMVDSVAIDTAYDGAVFDVDLIDIPERRSDLVEGAYELEAPDGDRPAAVRITDMLGEEILVVEDRPGV